MARGALSVVVLWRFADWRIVSLELVMALRGGGVFSVVKLSLFPFEEGAGEKCSLLVPMSRGVGPSVSAARRAYCIVKPSLLPGGGGEKCLQSQVLVRDAGVVWAGGFTLRLECEDACIL